MMGERLGKWILSREIGRGGMGRVYLAQEEVTGRQAALKILAAELAKDSGFLQRFQREIETLSKLTHPNIVQFYDAGCENGYYFYAMEFVEGQSLEDLIEHFAPLGWRETLEIALQICPALKHVHDHGVVHRDLKPSNILVRSDGVLKLTDFGVAKVFAGGHLTQTGGVVGTAEFISPEQAAGKPATKKSDIYSLGVVLYYLLVGKLPFVGQTPLDLLHKHRYAQYEKPTRYVPDLPYEIEEVVCSLLEKDPAKRPADCHVLAKLIDAVRRKLERKEQSTSMTLRDTVAENKPAFEPKTEGPATMFSRLVRAELERQNLGGPVAQFFNRPIVIVTLFLACIGVFTYAFWPADQETLFREGAKLMASDRLSELEIGWRDYLEPLGRRFPDHDHQDEVEAFKAKLDAARNPAPSEARRLFLIGERRLAEGDSAAAAHVWTHLVAAFDGIETERSSVQIARKRLAELQSPKAQADRLARVRPVLDRAAAHVQANRGDEAERLWAALEALYRDDPAGGAVLEAVRRARQP